MQKRGIVVILLVIIVAACTALIEAADEQGVSVSVENSAPSLTTPIPNQTWFVERSAVIDISQYLSDPNRDTVTYTVVGNRSIIVTINQSTGEVNFSQGSSFSGIEYVVFTATDPESAFGSSNNVTLNVTGDNVPPDWNNARKNRSTVYTNTLLRFSVGWTDNVGLSSSTFYVDQGSGWATTGPMALSGLTGSANATALITAAANTTVFWKFSAVDKYGNTNQTDVFNFTVAATPAQGQPTTVPPTTTTTTITTPAAEDDSGPGEAGIPVFVSPSYFEAKKRPLRPFVNFTVDPEMLHINMLIGGRETRGIKVTNTGNMDLVITVYQEGLGQFIELWVNNFTLEPGKSRIIAIDFVSEEDADPDIYVGKINFRHMTGYAKAVRTVVVLNHPKVDYSLGLWVAEHSKYVLAGSMVEAIMKILSLSDPKESDVTLYYAIKDFDGNTLDSNMETVSVEKELTLNRSLLVPKESQADDYLFYGRIVHDNNVSFAADSFEVVEELSILRTGLRISLLVLLLLLLPIIVYLIASHYRRVKYRARLLKLYFMISEAHKFVKEGKLQEATEMFVRIKVLYREKVPEAVLMDQEYVKKEIEKLYTEIVAKARISKEDREKAREMVEEEQRKQEQKEKPAAEEEQKKEIKEEKPDAEEEQKKEIKEEKPAAKEEQKKEIKGEKPDAKEEQKEEIKEEKPAAEEEEQKEEIKEEKPTAKKEEQKKEIKEEKPTAKEEEQKKEESKQPEMKGETPKESAVAVEKQKEEEPKKSDARFGLKRFIKKKEDKKEEPKSD
ncbi:MAG: hypothetical protein ABIB71_08255 [Candidatus Woesearchaeota archaeon]